MRRVTWLVAGMAMAAAIWLMQDVLQGADRTRIFVTFVSHNEESVSNPPCYPVLTDPARFAANRAATLALAQVVWDKRATWNVQTEWEYLLRMNEWETAAERDRTGGLNLVHYLNTMAPGHIEVDAHSHEKRGYNYADVAYLLSAFNVPPNGIVGGFTVNPVAQESWTRLREPLRGLKYPEYVWQATTLWGGASPGHRDDSNASGIWRPKDGDEFEVDDPDQALLAVGNYPGAGTRIDPESIQFLLDELRAGRLEPGRMYTATLMVEQCELDNDPSIIPAVGLLIDRFQADVQNGDLVWATLTEMVRVWREDYESAPLVAHPGGN